MKKIVLLFVALFSAFLNNLCAQQIAEQHVKAGYGVPVVQTDAEFPGGKDSLNIFIHSNLHYPEQVNDIKAGVQVKVMFTINKEGKIVDPLVMKGFSKEFNEEALRVVNLMPKWKPATAGGEPVDSQCFLPIDFRPPVR
jgi:hypothetical protein